MDKRRSSVIQGVPSIQTEKTSDTGESRIFPWTVLSTSHL